MADPKEHQEDDGGLAHATAEAHEGMPATAHAAAAPATGDEQHAEAAGTDHGKSLGNFLITHYTFALESDPKHKNSPKVSAPGLPPEKKYRQSFLGSPYGIKMQGTGLADDGHHIQYTGNGHYKYGVGGAAGPPSAWKTVAVDPRVIKLGSKLQIDIYKGKGDFTAKDTGGAIKGQHIDVFAGAIPISEAYALGTKHSVVRLLDGNHHDQHPSPGNSHGGGTGGTTPPKKGAHHITASVGKGGKNTDKDVRAVQARLKERGIDVKIDGDCGPKTIHAIEAFQSTFMDHPDGLISPGHGTEKHLFEENGKVHPKTPDKTPQKPDHGGNGSRDHGNNGGQQQHPDQGNHEAPSSYKDISKNFGASIPGSSHFTWHEALYLPSWGRHVQPSDVTNTSMDTVLHNIERQAKALDKVRDHFGASITVHCWLRPPAYNKQIGGASNSAHLRGTATDFHIAGKTAEQVRREIKSHQGLYPGAGENNVSWVHLDLEHHAWFNP